jgi:hypothetical protein
VSFSKPVPDGILSVLRDFRAEFPNDTLGVIHHGDALLTDQIVTHLESNRFWEVQRAEDLATGAMGKVVVGTAWELRGLEFPAAVVLDLECSGVADDLGTQRCGTRCMSAFRARVIASPCLFVTASLESSWRARLRARASDSSSAVCAH